MVSINISKSEWFSNYNRSVVKWKKKYSPVAAYSQLSSSSSSNT